MSFWTRQCFVPGAIYAAGAGQGEGHAESHVRRFWRLILVGADEDESLVVARGSNGNSWWALRP